MEKNVDGENVKWKQNTEKLSHLQLRWQCQMPEPIMLVCIPQSPAAHWDIPSKKKQGTTPAAPPEADTFVHIDVEFKFKASLQACAPWQMSYGF